MKQSIFLFLFLLLLSIPQFAYADDSWQIENYNSAITIQQSGTVQVIEIISVDFHTTPKHGIYRDIPYEYDSNGKQIYTNVAIKSVLQNNSPAQYTTTQTNGYDEVKIGDPNNTITGRNVYTITYTVIGVLRNVGTYDELYWNVTGNDWSVPIQKAEATVSLPNNGIAKVICYEGSIGSQNQCAANITSPKTAAFATTNSLTSSQGMTIAIDYTKGLIPLLTATPPTSYWERLLLWPSIAGFVGVVLIGLVGIGLLWYKYGRDYWFAGMLFGTKEQKGKVKPVGAHETISVEFMPPEKLRPAEIGVLIDERADTLDVTATIIDLATRGYLTITEIEKKWAFGKNDYLLTKSTPKKKQKLLSYEQLLLDKLFYKRRQVKLSTLKTTFYADLKNVKQALYDEVISKELFSADPEKMRRRYLFAAIILLVGGIWWTVYGSDHSSVFFGDTGLGFALDGVILAVISRYMPRRTAYGRELYRRAKGYYLFVDKSEKYRQRYFEKQNMFNEVLPYTIIFGLTKKFAKQMEKMGVTPEQTSWYISSHPFATGIFIGSVHDFSQSMSSAMATAPSSSGGFSGGSVCGGFGGGGGGSW